MRLWILEVRQWFRRIRQWKPESSSEDAPDHVKAAWMEAVADAFGLTELDRDEAAERIIRMASEKRLDGYSIVRRFVDERVKLKGGGDAGIYALLHALERQGVLQGVWGVEGGREMKFYSVTDVGRRRVEAGVTAIEEQLPTDRTSIQPSQ